MMGCLKMVESIRNKLGKLVSRESIDHSQATELLGVLKKMPLTYEILVETRIGVAVNIFRKASKDEHSIVLAKTLIKDWKTLVEKGKKQNSKQRSSGKVKDNTSARKGDSPNSSGQSSMSPSSTKHESSRKASKNEKSIVLAKSLKEKDSKRRSSGKVKDNNIARKEDSLNSSGQSSKSLSSTKHDSSTTASYTTDPVRLKCREMMIKALQQDNFNIDFEIMAGVLEDHIFKEFKNTDNKYKNRVRSRIYNLKDTKNPDFKQKVLEGVVTLERLAVMTSEEMASVELNMRRGQITMEAINGHQMAQQLGTKTGAFRCDQCGERNTSYNQLQTKSADEPMTTFIMCNCCGNRWKLD